MTQKVSVLTHVCPLAHLWVAWENSGSNSWSDWSKTYLIFRYKCSTECNNCITTLTRWWSMLWFLLGLSQTPCSFYWWQSTALDATSNLVLYWDICWDFLWIALLLVRVLILFPFRFFNFLNRWLLKCCNDQWWLILRRFFTVIFKTDSQLSSQLSKLLIDVLSKQELADLGVVINPLFVLLF